MTMSKKPAPLIFVVLALGAYAIYQTFLYQKAEADYPAKLLDSVVMAALQNPANYTRLSTSITREGSERIRVRISFAAEQISGIRKTGEATLSLMDPALHSLQYAELSAKVRAVLKDSLDKQKKADAALDPRNAFVESVSINGTALPEEETARLAILGQRGNYPFDGPVLEPLLSLR